MLMLMLLGWTGLVIVVIALTHGGIMQNLRNLHRQKGVLLLLVASIICLVFTARDAEEPPVVQMSVAEMRRQALDIPYEQLLEDIDKYRGQPLAGRAEVEETVSEDSFRAHLTRENGTWSDVAYLVLKGEAARDLQLSAGDVIEFVGVVWGEHRYRVVRRTFNYPYGLYLTVPEIHAYEVIRGGG
ncbi:MAG: hypothetical protein R6U70_03665 [Bacillota bacterium]